MEDEKKEVAAASSVTVRNLLLFGEITSDELADMSEMATRLTTILGMTK